MVGPPPARSCTSLGESRWTERATCSPPNLLAFARSLPTGSSPRWPATARRASPVMAGRPSTFNYRIRRISPNGIITTVAGNGEFGISGDGGAAISAKLAVPLDVAADNDGNLFISDPVDNGRIRKISSSGEITTIAGGGNDFPGDGGPATSAAISPAGIAADGAG